MFTVNKKSSSNMALCDNQLKFSCVFQDYKIENVIAKCFFERGVVMLAEHQPDNSKVVLKEYAIDNINADEYDSIKCEIVALRQLSHPNILSLLVTFVHDESLYLGMPLMVYGSCKDILRNFLKSGFPESFIAIIIRDVLHGLKYLHNHGYIHRAIRASHILINSKNAVLGGFRDCVATVTNGTRISKLHSLSCINKASLNWHAPEILEQNLLGYSDKSDIYSVGITCCELTSGVEPYFNMEPTLMMVEKVKGHIPELLDQMTCPDQSILLDSGQKISYDHIYRGKMFSEDFHEFTEICTKKNPTYRWSAENLLTHSFFKQCRSTSLSHQLNRLNIRPIDEVVNCKFID